MVKLHFQKFGLRPPPLIDMLFEVEIENSSDQMMWYLFPLYLGEFSEFGQLLASSVEISELSGKGQLRVARFLGKGSFQAMYIRPKARIRIHEFAITLVDDPPKTEVTVPIILVEQLNIGDKPAQDWLPIDLTSPLKADVTDEPGAIIASQGTRGANALPVTPSGIEVVTMQISLKQR